MLKSLVTFLIVFYCSGIYAQQLCDGNLGMNIFTDGDFGSGTANVVATDPGIAPGYIYQPSQATPPDGSYVITNNTGSWGFHFPAWLRLTDNSDDPNGYFMLVNASFDAGVFYSNQVTDLCENTLYEFSADIINVIQSGTADHIFPNVSFLIDDVVVFSTGNILQTETWNKYGFTFTTDPGQTEVKLSLINNADGGRGNDLAIDNISFQACGPDAFVSADETLFLCADDTMPAEITADISAGNQAIRWQTSTDSITWMDIPDATDRSIFHDNFDVGKYYYRYVSANSNLELSNDFCNIISDVLLVEVVPLEYEIDSTICFNEIFELGSQDLSANGTYYESFISSIGCDSLVTLNLTVLEEEILDFDYIPIDPLCYDGSDGSLEIIITDGLLGPYSFDVNGFLSTENIITDLVADDYIIQVINQNNCVQSFEAVLNNPPEFILTLPSDTIINLGESLEVNVSATETIKDYIWSSEELSPYSNMLNFGFTPLLSQTHTALATNEQDCSAVESFTVTINLENLRIYFPNAIDHNSKDGNHIFTIGAQPNLITEVTNAYIYDRWGNLVAHQKGTTDLNIWDGRIDGQKAEAGVYVYIIELTLLDGNVYTFDGQLTLVR